MTAKKRKYHRRRYYLHNKARKYGIRINVVNRSLDISPYTSFNEFPVPGRYYLGQLLKLGYNLQHKLFQHD